MLFFCPVHVKWSEYERDGNFSYRQNLPFQNFAADITEPTIINLWNYVTPPPAPRLHPAVINTKTSALLILDMEKSICKSSRCIDSIYKIHKLLARARKENMLVVYSLIPNGIPEDIFDELEPLPDEPIVKSNVDKF